MEMIDKFWPAYQIQMLPRSFLTTYQMLTLIVIYYVWILIEACFLITS